MPLITMNRGSREQDSQILKKTTAKVVPPTIKGGKGILETINSINALVNTKLGKYKEKYDIIRDHDKLHEYIDFCISNGICAIDTETTSLDPITTTIAGVCIYTPNHKAVYVPLNHKSYITNEKVQNQCDMNFMRTELERLSNTKIIMHNAKFDIRVIKNQLGVTLNCYWDTMLASKCLNENESAGLKDLHLKYCKSEDTESLSYDKLFEGIEFVKVPITSAYLYAAGDAIKTYELYLFQDEVLKRPYLSKVRLVFFDIEMKILPVIVSMEDTGVSLDMELAQELSIKYNAQLKEREELFYQELKNYESQINDFRLNNPTIKLDDPLNIGSPSQLAVLFYDILGLTSPDSKKPRGTGEDILTALNHPLSKLILDYRETAKLINTYIDKLPKSRNSKTGKIHCSFNQYGAATGRFSSSEPNLQNIPSHNKEIRKMFVAEPGKVFISADYSQQEPRFLSQLSNDENMINAYKENKDIYAWIASFIYNVPYDECKEFRPDGTKNPEGKERRTSVKSIILGLMYGRSTKSIAEQLGVSVQKAQEITDKFFNSFPNVKKFVESTEEFAKVNGFVETAWGRKRRLPDMQLPDFELKYDDAYAFDPLDFDSNEKLEVSEQDRNYYINKLQRCRFFRDRLAIKEEAKRNGIIIKDNTGFIAEAQRQCVNSIIQGSSADCTKLAMINIHNDSQLQDMGCRLVIQIHDEVIVEVPEENARKCAERLSEIMIEAPKSKLSVPMKVDTEITKCWYGEEIKL